MIKYRIVDFNLTDEPKKRIAVVLDFKPTQPTVYHRKVGSAFAALQPELVNEERTVVHLMVPGLLPVEALPDLQVLYGAFTP